MRILPILLYCFLMSDFAYAEPLAKQLFGAKSNPSAHQAQPLGSYAKGCLAGAEQLPETGPTWQAMRLSRNRNWGHPETIATIKELSRVAVSNGWMGLYVGDISQPRGGPMLTGHRSHQIGLDADIWMLPPTRLNLTREERENISSIAVTDGKQPAVNRNWTRAHYNIIKAAAQHPKIARVFVNAAIKYQMCQQTGPGNRRWLGKVRPWWGHNYHFHIRLHCPAGQAGCANQAPVPNGDDCENVLSWFAPPPPPKPGDPKPKKRRELVMRDLPGNCAVVLQN